MSSSYKDADFLKSYIGQIVVIHARNEDEIPRWKAQRQKHLYNGTITNHNLREIIKEEIIIEFDSKGDVTLDDIQKESIIYINMIKDKLISTNTFFRITNHNGGKSPHIRFIVEGLEYHDKKHVRIYKETIVHKILEEINFKSEIIQLDNSLLTSISKLVSIEKQPHFKKKYNGNIEEIIFENTNGNYHKMDMSLMTSIIQQVEQSNKIDRGIIEEKIDIVDIDIESLKVLWKKYYVPGSRNALIMALGGICLRKGLDIDQSIQVLTILLKSINQTQWLHTQINELKYTYIDDKNIAVWYYIRERCGLQIEEAQIFYKEFTECFGDEKKEEIQIPGKFRLMSEFIDDLIIILKDKRDLFYKIYEQQIVKIENNEFVEINASEFITYIEKYVVPGTNTEDGFVKKSITKEVATNTINSDKFKKSLQKIKTIYTTPIPIFYNNQLTFPKKGYDERFESWLSHNSPSIKDNISIDDAKKNILFIFQEFCFKTEQDRTNAIAALITPFLRGLYLRNTCRTPAILYQGNRPRCGKDYCAGITGILYEGQASEESAISNDDNKKSNHTEELRKKLMSGMKQGKKRFHFSNNRGHLSNTTLEGFITNEYFSDRLLGKNEIVEFPNEVEISLSANIGLTYSEDFDKRSIKINLFFADEDANRRTFNLSDLWGYVLENREMILSSIYSIIKDWFNKGMKKGETPFTSFNEWSKICGGIMNSANFGDPCINNTDDSDIGGDNETNDFKILFELCYQDFKCKKFLSSDFRKKAQIYSESHDIFKFLDFEDKRGQTIFGINVKKYVGRILSDIELKRIKEKGRTSLNEYALLKNNDILINELYVKSENI